MILILPYLHVRLDFPVISAWLRPFIDVIYKFFNIFNRVVGVNKLALLISITRRLINPTLSLNL